MHQKRDNYRYLYLFTQNSLRLTNSLESLRQKRKLLRSIKLCKPDVWMTFAREEKYGHHIPHLFAGFHAYHQSTEFYTWEWPLQLDTHLVSKSPMRLFFPALSLKGTKGREIVLKCLTPPPPPPPQHISHLRTCMRTRRSVVIWLLL